MKPASCRPEPSFSGRWRGAGGSCNHRASDQVWDPVPSADAHAQRPVGEGDVVTDGGSLGTLAAAALSPENGREGPEKIEGWDRSAELPSAQQHNLRAATPGRSAAPRQLCLCLLLSLKESQGGLREGVSHPQCLTHCSGSTVAKRLG